jgi:hypothetical protein
MKREVSIFYTGAAICFTILSSIALLTEGTGGGGDSILHFLISKYSWQHPELFLDHWGKPLYTLISSPFAQFGFKGIKLFNCVVAFAACWFTYLTAKQLQLKHAHWVWVLFFFTPFNITNTLSGLTEPLFGLILITATYFYTKGDNFKATFIVSFLPFVRSEGLIILCVYVAYLIAKKQYKMLPLLAIGHLVLSIAGVFIYKDILWVFNRIPYAKMSTTYGVGTWNHFFIHMNFMIGPMLYILLGIGIITYLLNLVFKKEIKHANFNEHFFLIYGTFAGFFVAHTLFWTLAIFGSMGLTRVFVGVMPLMAIIMLDGLNSITQNKFAVNERLRSILFFLIIGVVILFPFLDNPAALNLKHDFTLDDSQQLIKHKIAPYIESNHPDKKLYYSDYQLAYFLEEDIFKDRFGNTLFSKEPSFDLKENELIIWDDWFSVLEEGVQKAKLDSLLSRDTSFHTTTYKGSEVEYIIYKVKQ